VGRDARRSRGLTYADSGVDIDAADRALKGIKDRVRATFRPEVLSDIGSFAGLFRLSGYNDPVLVSSVDGVGTKVKIAITMDRHDTVGIDLVNHCVNDIFTCGAEPLFFLDYLATGKLAPGQLEGVVSGLARACEAVGCALIGGETAEMPGIYAPGDYDLAGFIVGVVEKGGMLDTGSIAVGDAVLGMPSSGLHTNGYSLVRKVFGLDEGGPAALDVEYPELGRTLGEELLEPHRCYYPALHALLSEGSGGGGTGGMGGVIKGMAHITGGGLIDNVGRVLPENATARFEAGSWTVPPIFGLVQERGGVASEEMYRVFNMGVGMVVMCAPVHVDPFIKLVPEARVIGEIVDRRGNDPVVINYGL
jgi:phosphoribosylformylglycinamidine cyclo-ligase